MSTGILVMLIFFWFRVPSQLQFLQSGVRAFVTSFLSVHCLIENSIQAPGLRDELDAKTLVVDQGIVELKNVSFGYCGQKELLSELDLKVHSGQTVALVGESGSGKTSILNLLLRICDSTQGKVLIDEQDIQQVTVESLRANIGVVPQEKIWFHNTIMDNIRYANSSVQDEQIYKACIAVGLHGLISSLKNGYKTIMGEGGVRPSTGELRRLAIARGVVSAGKVVILDEPTSNVDSRTEYRILRNIKALFPGRTVLIASNRPSTTAHADHILVLRHESVVEQGTHASLMSKGGHYYSLWSRGVGGKRPTSHQKHSYPNEMATYESEGAKSLKNIPLGENARSQLKSHKPTYMNETLDRHENNPAEHNATESMMERGIWRPDAPEFVPSSAREF
ncbi:P-loop containing nucleoside triphosphate hydrolase protein [Aspergillus taichungensis]|uniref:P-loop containing nucleoside triphosphate hydrolase protein n=1 Tax=Aspergillus taichungensis TaxID=482145 RepID=A0A2J5HRF2_9EURO|nr:P-loop containing nucleoside triphosphate hydrolase protein [Aspergillus taichungensis]